MDDLYDPRISLNRRNIWSCLISQPPIMALVELLWSSEGNLVIPMLNPRAAPRRYKARRIWDLGLLAQRQFFHQVEKQMPFWHLVSRMER
jgi:hypothetical protein